MVWRTLAQEKLTIGITLVLKVFVYKLLYTNFKDGNSFYENQHKSTALAGWAQGGRRCGVWESIQEAGLLEKGADLLGFLGGGGQHRRRAEGLQPQAPQGHGLLDGGHKLGGHVVNGHEAVHLALVLGHAGEVVLAGALGVTGGHLGGRSWKARQCSRRRR